jgi:FkbM family methyltransferase
MLTDSSPHGVSATPLAIVLRTSAGVAPNGRRTLGAKSRRTGECRMLVDGTATILDQDAEHLVNMATGSEMALSSLVPAAIARLRARWEQAGHLVTSLAVIVRRHGAVISQKRWAQETVEQSMSMRFLNGTENVLELGGCIGRNSLVIASILNEHGGKLVTVEPQSGYAAQLKQAKATSGLQFAIIDRPVSRQRMVMDGGLTKCIGPDDKVSEVPRRPGRSAGWVEVPTITLEDVKTNTGVQAFDTLVVDCEGAFYSVLNEFPEVMTGVTKVVIENDSRDADEAEAIHVRLRENGLVPVWSQPFKWGPVFPKAHEFWQCWVKLA